MRRELAEAPAMRRPHLERVNVYVCEKCGGKTTTVDVDHGVTPMFLACRASGDVEGCDGRAVSSMYRPEPPYPPPAWEWYRPSSKAGLEPAARDHVERGGLLLRKIVTA